MRKKFLKASFLTAILVVASVMMVSAQGGDVMTFATSFTLQNLESTTATVNLDFYDTAGTKVANSSESIATSAGYYAPTYAPLNGVNSLNGALVVSSDKRLASIANQVAMNATSKKNANATYSGFSSDTVKPIMYSPVVMKNFFGYYTELSVQSAGGDINVNVEYFNSSGKVGDTRVVAVKANSPVRIAQASDAGLPDGFLGSAKVSAADGTTPIALIVNEFVGTTGAMYNQFYSFEGFSSGANNVTLPAVFINGFGAAFNASMSAQNIGAGNATVVMSFFDNTPGNPSPNTEIYSTTVTIPANQSHSVYFPDAAYADTLKNAYNSGDGAWVGAVTLKSDQPIIAIANQLQGTHQAASYRGLTGGGSVISFPLAFSKAFGFADTSFTIADMNATGSPVNVNIEYIADKTLCPTCSNQTFSNVAFTNSLGLYQPDHITTGKATGSNVFVGSVKITATTAGAKINGIMNELLGGDTADNFTSFNATVVTP